MAYIPGAETSSEVDYREGVGLDLIAEFQQQAGNPNYNHTFEVDWAQCEELIVECDSQPNSDTPASADAGIKLLISNETVQWWYRQLIYSNVNKIQSTTNWTNAPAGSVASNHIWLHGVATNAAKYGCYGKISLRRNSDHTLFGTQYMAYSTPGERVNTAPNLTAQTEVFTTAALENRVSKFSIQPTTQNISKNYHIKVWARRTVATVDISALELVWEGKIDGSLQKPVQIPIRQTGEDTIHFEFTARRLPNAAVSALSDTILGNMTMGFTYNTLNAVAGSWYTADTADSSRTVDTCGRLTLESANRMNTNSGYGTIFKHVDTEDPSKGAGNPRIAVSMHLDERGDAYNSASYCRPCWMSTATRSTAADVTNNLYLHVHRQYELDIRFYRKANVAQLAHSPDHQSGLVVTNAGKNTVEISAGNIEVNGRVLHNRFPMTVYLPDALRNGDAVITSAAMYLYAANNHGELNIKFAQDGPVYDRYGNQYRDISAMPENVAAYHPKEGRTWRWFASLEIDKDGMITNIVQRHNAYTVSTLGGGNIPDAVGTIRYAMPGAEVPSFWLRADGSEFDPAAWPELAKVIPPIGTDRLKPTGYEVYDTNGVRPAYPLANLFDGTSSFAHSTTTFAFPTGTDPRDVYASWGFVFAEPISLRAWRFLAGSVTALGTAVIRGMRLFGQEDGGTEWVLLDDSHWPCPAGTGDTGLYAAFDQLSFLAATDKKWKKLRLDLAPTMYSEHPIYGEELFLYGEGDKYILPNIPTTDTGLSYIVAARKVYNGEKPPLDAWDNLYVPGNVYINHSDSDIVGAIKYVMPGSAVPDFWIRADGRAFDPVKYPELATVICPQGTGCTVPNIPNDHSGEAYIVAKMENRQQKVNVDVMSSDDVGTIKEIFGVPQKKSWLPCNGQEFDPAMWPELAKQLGPSYSDDIIPITATEHGPATSLAGGSLATATNGVYTPVSNTGAQMGYVEAGTRQYVIAALNTPSEIACVKAAVGWQANQYPAWDARQFRLYATETDAGDDNWTEIGRSVDWTSGIEEYYGHEIFVWEPYRSTKWHRIKIEALGTRQNSNNGQTSFILRELTAHAPSVDVYRVPLLYPAHNGAQVYIIAQSDSTVSVHGDDAYIGELRQFHLKTPPTGWYVCNGQVIQNANEKCPLLLKHLVDNSWKCVTEDVWQEKRNAAQETGAAGGVPYYVYDLIANTLRLPNIMGDVFKSAPTSDRVGEWEKDDVTDAIGASDAVDISNVLLLPCVCYDSSFVEKATTFAAPEPSDPVVHSSVEIGTIMQYVAGAEPPANWIKCDGKALDTEAYPELAKILSHITDFNVKLTNITAAASATSIGNVANLLDDNTNTYWCYYTSGNTNWETQEKPSVIFTFSEPTDVGGCAIIAGSTVDTYGDHRGFSSLKIEGSTDDTSNNWTQLAIERKSVDFTGEGKLKFALAPVNSAFPKVKRIRVTFGNIRITTTAAANYVGVEVCVVNFYRPGSTICVPNIPNIHPMYENYIVAKGAVPVSSVATTGGYVVSDSEADTPDVGVLILTEDAVTASGDIMIVSAHEGDVTDKAMVGLREDTAGVGTASGKITVSDTPADLDTSGILIVTK